MNSDTQAAHDAMKYLIKPYNLFDCLCEFDLWLNEATIEELETMLKMCDCYEGELHAIVIKSHITNIT